MPDRAQSPGQSVEDCPFFLSPRERQSLQLAAKGHTSKGIALELAIAEQTAKHYLRQARAKLAAFNTTHAVAIALALGLISIEIETYKV